MIESVHADNEPEGNGDDSDGSRDDTPKPPIICSRGFERHHFLSLHPRRQRDQSQLVDSYARVITPNAGGFDDPKPDVNDIRVGGSLFSSKEIAAVEPRRPASFRSRTKNRDLLLFGDHPRPRPKMTGQVGFGAAEPPREAMSLPGCIPPGRDLGYS